MIRQISTAASSVLLAGLFACAPKHGPSDAPATRTHFQVVGAVTTSGLELPTFNLIRNFDVDVQVAKSNSDGSRLVGVKWGETILLARVFPDGELLAVAPMASARGAIPEIESFDWLWLTLFRPPHPSDHVETSFPLWVSGAPRLSGRLIGSWFVSDVAETLTGTVDWSARDVSASATINVVYPRESMASTPLVVDRTVTTRWPGGEVRQTVQWASLATPVGAAPAFLRPPLPGDGTREHDGDPVLRSDGTPILDAAVDPRKALLFLLLPDEIGDGERDAIRARLAAPATIPVPAGPP